MGQVITVVDIAVANGSRFSSKKVQFVNFIKVHILAQSHSVQMKVAMTGDLACLARSVAREAILVFYLALVIEKELQ